MNKTFAYIRVSSKDQNEARQLAAIEGLGINERDVYIDKQSGKDFDRPKYQALKATLRQGDTLFIKELDRLGRNADEIKREWHDITHEIGAYIVVIEMPILDTRPKENAVSGIEKVITNIVFELLSYMAQKERETIRARQAEGIAAAKKDGKQFGRPRQGITAAFITAYEQWKVQGEITAVAAMELAGMSKDTFYRRVKEYETQKGGDNA